MDILFLNYVLQIPERSKPFQWLKLKTNFSPRQQGSLWNLWQMKRNNIVLRLNFYIYK